LVTDLKDSQRPSKLVLSLMYSFIITLLRMRTDRKVDRRQKRWANKQIHRRTERERQGERNTQIECRHRQKLTETD